MRFAMVVVRTSLDFCFFLRFILRTMLVCRHRRLDRSRRAPTLDCSPILVVVFLSQSCPSVSCVSSSHYSRILRPFSTKCTVSSAPSFVFAYRLIFSLICSPLAVSAPSRFERSFCTFHYDFVLPPENYHDFLYDFDSSISSVYVHIVPRWTLTYQVCAFMMCQPFGERYQWSCIGILYGFSLYFSFSPLSLTSFSR